MLHYPLCKDGDILCWCRHAGCDAAKSVIESVFWREGSKGTVTGSEMIVSLRCGISAIYSRMENPPAINQPERYTVGEVAVPGAVWVRALFGYFPTVGKYPDMPLFMSESGTVIRRTRRIANAPLGTEKSTTNIFRGHHFSSPDSAGRPRAVTAFSAIRGARAAFMFKEKHSPFREKLSPPKKPSVHVFDRIDTNGGQQKSHELHGVEGTGEKVTALQLSHDGKRLVIGTSKGNIFLSNGSLLDECKFIKLGRRLNGPIFSISWSSCNLVFGVCSPASPQIFLFRSDGNEFEHIAQKDTASIYIGSNYSKIVSKTMDGRIIVFSYTPPWSTGTELLNTPIKSLTEAKALSLSPDGHKLVTYHHSDPSILITIL